MHGNLLCLIKSFLHNRHQRVVLNGQSSNWRPITAGALQGSVFGPLFFLVYINDLPQGLKSEVKLFADHSSLFSVVNCLNTSTSTFNNDLMFIQGWASHSTLTKKHDVLFSKETKSATHPPLFFNTIEVKLTSARKQLGLNLDSKLAFNKHIADKMNRAMKGIGLLRKLRSILPRPPLLITQKSFIRHHLNYGNAIYYQELGLEHLNQRRWIRHLCLPYKVLSTKQPADIHNLLPPVRKSSRHLNTCNTFYCRIACFKNSFFASVVDD